jgi:hypothetical protein
MKHPARPNNDPRARKPSVLLQVRLLGGRSEMGAPMPKQDIQNEILILLAAKLLERKSDIFRLTKLEFLHRVMLEKASGGAPMPFFARFLRDNFGPVCPEVYDATRESVAVGLLESHGPNGREKLVTTRGLSVISHILPHIDPTTVTQITRLATELERRSFNEIKAACYAKTLLWRGRPTKVMDVPIGEEVFPHPGRWRQVIPDETLRAFEATMTALRAGTVVDERRGLAALEPLLN